MIKQFQQTVSVGAYGTAGTAERVIVLPGVDCPRYLFYLLVIVDHVVSVVSR